MYECEREKQRGSSHWRKNILFATFAQQSIHKHVDFPF